MDFIRANGGKIALIAAIVVVASVVFAMQGGGVKAPSGKAQYVCVQTGKTFWLERGRPRILPETNPDTGEKTLLPCYKDEDGVVRVGPSCRSLVNELTEQQKNKYIDRETLVVLASPQ